MGKTQRADKTQRSEQQPRRSDDWLWTASDRRIAAREDSEELCASDYAAALSRAAMVQS